jgi:hypothetical protein
VNVKVAALYWVLVFNMLLAENIVVPGPATNEHCPEPDCITMTWSPEAKFDAVTCTVIVLEFNNLTTLLASVLIS